MKKLSLMLISVSLISCNNFLPTQPRPPIVPDCAIIGANNGSFYLHCVNSNDSTVEWTVPIEYSKGYSCTTPEGRGEMAKFSKETQAWINNNCKK